MIWVKRMGVLEVEKGGVVLTASCLINWLARNSYPIVSVSSSLTGSSSSCTTCRSRRSRFTSSWAVLGINYCLGVELT